jgi:four helix bundle protein
VAFLFESLSVYQRAVELACDIAIASRQFPPQRRWLGSQLSRAAASVCANIAESNGRRSRRDRAHLLIVARGSAFECVPLLEIAARLELLSPSTCLSHRKSLEEIGRALSALASR